MGPFRNGNDYHTGIPVGGVCLAGIHARVKYMILMFLLEEYVILVLLLKEWRNVIIITHFSTPTGIPI